MTHSAVKDYVIGIKAALEQGNISVAHHLAAEAIEQHPEDEMIQTYAQLLAPPQVTSVQRSPHPDLIPNQTWINQHRLEYKGQWIALRAGQLLAHAHSSTEFNQQLNQIDDLENVFLTVIH